MGACTPNLLPHPDDSQTAKSLAVMLKKGRGIPRPFEQNEQVISGNWQR